jgi:hypothetical protein
MAMSRGADHAKGFARWPTLAFFCRPVPERKAGKALPFRPASRFACRAEFVSPTGDSGESTDHGT